MAGRSEPRPYKTFGVLAGAFLLLQADTLNRWSGQAADMDVACQPAHGETRVNRRCRTRRDSPEGRWEISRANQNEEKRDAKSESIGLGGVHDGRNVCDGNVGG